MTQRKTTRRRTPAAAHGVTDHTDDPLRSVADFATRVFPSSDAAITAALETLRDLCPCPLLFLARATVAAPHGTIIRLLSRANAPQRDAATANALLRDYATQLASLTTPTILGNGAEGTPGRAVVLPLCRNDGQLWGWLIGVDPPRQVPSPDLLQVFAGLVVRHVEREASAALSPDQQPTPATAQGHTAELEAVVMAISDALFLHDAAGHLVRMNPAGRALLAVDETAAVAGEMSDRAARWDLRDADGHPMDPETWPLARVLRGEQFAGNDAVDVWMHAADGQQRIISFSGAPIRAHDGTITGAVTLAHDVTTRRQLERRTRLVLEALLGMATALVGTPDDAAHQRHDLQQVVTLTQQVLDGRHASILRVNPTDGHISPEAMVGLPGEWWAAVQNSQVTDYLPPDGLAQLLRGEALILDVPSLPTVPGHPHFDVQTALIIATPLEGGDLCILSVEPNKAAAFTAADIGLARAAVQLAALVIERERLLRERTAAQARELALQATNDQMLTFLGIAGHELRTPVTSLKVTAQLTGRAVATALQDDLTPATMKALTRVQGLLTIADRQVGKLNDLIGDLLDVTRIQAGKLELHPTTVDLVALARATAEVQQLSWPNRAIILDLPAEPAEVACDADRVEQVILNFLTNALKYSASEQPITVSVQPLADGVRVAVTDQGPGIPPEAQAHLWELFHQVPGIQQQSGSGIGLGIGLYLCRTIIERHGGTVGVDSQPGQGSTFWFTLPHVPVMS